MDVKICVHENWKCYLQFCTYTAYDRPRHAHYMYMLGTNVKPQARLKRSGFYIGP